MCPATIAKNIPLSIGQHRSRARLGPVTPRGVLVGFFVAPTGPAVFCAKIGGLGWAGESPRVIIFGEGHITFPSAALCHALSAVMRAT